MTATDLLDNFLDETKELQKVLTDAGSARKKSHLSSSSRDSVVELVHLRVVALFESFVEDLLHDCLAGTSNLQGVVPKVTTTDPELLKDFVAPDGKFISLSKFQDLSKRASSLMLKSPFSRLDYRVQDRTALNEWIIVRNAIAHSSGPAKHKFAALAASKKYQAKRPADYLTSILGEDAEGEIALARIRALAKALTCDTEKEANTHLLPERDFQADDLPPGGNYSCKTCKGPKHIESGSKLGGCTACGYPQRCDTCNRKQSSNTLWRREITI